MLISYPILSFPQIRKDRAYFLRLLGVRTRKRGKRGQKVGVNAIIDACGMDPLTFQFYPSELLKETYTDMALVKGV